MSADPLADLLADLANEMQVNPRLSTAEWLRANRDRVLEALGGRLIGTTARKGPTGMAAVHVLGPATDVDGAPVWMFPKAGE